MGVTNPAWNMHLKCVDRMEGSMQELENIQEILGKLVGGSSTVAGGAVRGDLGWRKLEERREEKKLFGWRLQRVSEDRLVRKVVALLNDC